MHRTSLPIIERADRVTLSTADREYLVGGTVAHPYTIYEHIQDWVQMGCEHGVLDRISRSSIYHHDEDGEWESALYRITCPVCYRRFIDVGYADPITSSTSCPHCGEMIEH